MAKKARTRTTAKPATKRQPLHPLVNIIGLARESKLELGRMIASPGCYDVEASDAEIVAKFRPLLHTLRAVQAIETEALVGLRGLGLDEDGEVQP